MSRTLRWLLWTATIAATVTGLAFVAMRELMVSDDPFSAYNHPLQPWALAAHVLIAPLLVLVLGWIWGVHAAPRRVDPRARARRSGLVNIAIAAVMVASGYLLQVVTEETVRLALAWTHGVSGTLFALSLTVHAVVGVRSRINGTRLPTLAPRPPGLRAPAPVVRSRAAARPASRDAAPSPEKASGSP
ncbi:MAG: hypothetical protein Kow0062_05900 [Acidobacteriota bacterium]